MTKFFTKLKKKLISKNVSTKRTSSNKNLILYFFERFYYSNYSTYCDEEISSKFFIVSYFSSILRLVIKNNRNFLPNLTLKNFACSQCFLNWYFKVILSNNTKMMPSPVLKNNNVSCNFLFYYLNLNMQFNLAIFIEFNKINITNVITRLFHHLSFCWHFFAVFLFQFERQM